jgi:hypothetical protein
MSEVFDPHNVKIMEFNGDGVVNELDYRTLLLLYADARKYAELEQTSRKYWSMRAKELSDVLQKFMDDGYNRELAEKAIAGGLGGENL